MPSPKPISRQLVRRQRLRAELRCVQCAAQDTRTLGGKARCEACEAKNADHTRRSMRTAGGYRAWKPGGPGRPPKSAAAVSI